MTSKCPPVGERGTVAVTVGSGQSALPGQPPLHQKSPRYSARAGASYHVVLRPSPFQQAPFPIVNLFMVAQARLFIFIPRRRSGSSIMHRATVLVSKSQTNTHSESESESESGISFLMKTKKK